jgi:hypothetical protein
MLELRFSRGAVELAADAQAVDDAVEEVLASLRTDPDGSFGWWRALEVDLDDATADALIDWWGESLAQDRLHSVEWTIPRVLAAARPHLLPKLIDIRVRRPVRSDEDHGGTALGHALRDHPVYLDTLLDRFLRGSAEEQAGSAFIASGEAAADAGTDKLANHGILHSILETAQSAPNVGEGSVRSRGQGETDHGAFIERLVIAWTFSTMRLMLFFDGRYPRRAWPVLAEYIRPNE